MHPYLPLFTVRQGRTQRPSFRGAPGMHPSSQSPITNQYHCPRVFLGLREELRPLILRSGQEQLPCVSTLKAVPWLAIWGPQGDPNTAE